MVYRVMKKYFFLICYMFFNLTTTACAKELTIACPQSIDVTQSATPVKGWETVDEATPIVLDRVAVYSGHPREKASLVPDGDEDMFNTKHDVWTLHRKSKDDDFWISCVYINTTIMLVKKVPQSSNAVIVEYDNHPGGTRLGIKRVVFR
jgi:hypothetical protein